MYKDFFNNIRFFLRKFISFIENNKLSPSLISTIFLLGSIVVPNNKLLFVWSGLYLFFQLLSTKSFFLTLIYSFLPLSLMVVGQTYVFTATPFSFLKTSTAQSYIDGRKLFFIFSPYYAFSITLIFVVFISFFNKKLKKVKLNKNTLILILLLIVGQQVISSSKSSFLPTVSILYSMKEVGLVSFIWVSIRYLGSQSKRKKNKIFKEIYRQLVIVSIFQGLIVMLQVLSKSSLGLTIEISKSISSFGLGMDESFAQFRPKGLSSHANNLANDLLISLFGLNLFFNFNKKSKNVQNKKVWLGWIAMGLVMMALVLTLSRAAYLSMFLYFLSLRIFLKKDFFKEWKFLINFYSKYKKYLYLVMLIALVRVAPRVMQTFYSFGFGGGFFVRRELVSLSFEIFKKYPFMGVGRGMFIPSGFAINPMGVMSYFPEAVHNGFLLLLVERGLVGLFLNLLFIYLFIKTIYKTLLSKYMKYKIIFASIALASVMLFHPINNILSIYTLLVILIL